MTQLELHEHLFQILIDEKVIFMPRQINRFGRLEEGYWFLKGPDYTSVTFWNGYDNDSKIPNISLMFNNGLPISLNLCVSHRSDPSLGLIAEEIRRETGLENYGKNRWEKVVHSDIRTVSELKKVIKYFLQTDKEIIDAIVDKANHPQLKMISEDEFLEKIDKINSYRSLEKKVNYSSSETIGARDIRRVSGRISKSEEEQVRNVLAKRLIIKSQHNPLQNQLFADLRKQFPFSYLIMEEDFIDLKMESPEEIRLYEVKPYPSVRKCIREGLGQLLSYYHDLKNPLSKKVTLIVFGPNSPNEEEKRFIRFVQITLNLNFDYQSKNM